jgi:prepilin-type N-terminal cleavage/methylation domain-containing protein
MLARIRHRPRRRDSSGGLRGGFTLIEMLIAMTLTLIMVWAIAEFYARVGEAVKDGRAMIDQRSAMRTATQLLMQELELVTVVTAPPAEDETTPLLGNPTQRLSVLGPGYLEIYEGLGSDADPEGNGIDILPAGGNGIPDIADDLTPANGIPDFIENTLAPNVLGDIDDYIGFTIRSAGEPFMAQVVTLPIVTATTPSNGIMTGTAIGGANLAEVAWWTSFNDDPLLTTSLGSWEPAETRSLHRRLLLVCPEKNVIHLGDNQEYIARDANGNPVLDANGNQIRLPYYFRIAIGPTSDYHSVMQFCDVSVRPVFVSNNFVYYYANSLADLTRRENRFLHVGVGLLTRAEAFPNPLDLNPNYGGNSTLARGHATNNFSQYRWILGQLPGAPPPFPSRRGEDVILSNVLAFDVRVFDPMAALRYDNALAANATGTLQPGDPGYKHAVDNNFAIAGAGAYVDLWYNRYVLPVVPANSSSTFSGPPLAKSQLLAAGPPPGATYCTWAASYERDGLNQDWGPAGDNVANINTAPFDEGTDGLDNDLPSGFNGVDDTAERETSPPYPTRLRGLEVKIRTYDPGTRQEQQATVGTDFIPE